MNVKASATLLCKENVHSSRNILNTDGRFIDSSWVCDVRVNKLFTHLLARLTRSGIKNVMIRFDGCYDMAHLTIRLLITVDNERFQFVTFCSLVTSAVTKW